MTNVDKPFNKYFDHTLLKPDASNSEIEKLCDEAIRSDFYSVCVNPFYVSLSKSLLRGTDVNVCSVVGFPLGASETEIKIMEAQAACNNGANEIDMVINLGAVKNRNYESVKAEIQKIALLCHNHEALLKVIIETCLLDKAEIISVSRLVEDAGADFVKTSTGFSSYGADIDSLKLIKKSVSENMRIKASGGIRDLNTAISMINAGVDRIGASKSVEIMNEYFLTV